MLYQGTPSHLLVQLKIRLQAEYIDGFRLVWFSTLSILVELLLFSSEKLAVRDQILCILNLLDDTLKFYIVILLTVVDVKQECTHQVKKQIPAKRI
jgi:hypothetical protein